MTRGVSVAVACVAVLGAACTGDVAAEFGGGARPAVLELPAQLVGLSVVPEDVGSNLETIDRPYVDSVAVFSMRDGDLLKATLQVARFNRLARPGDASFRNSIVSTIGGRRPVAFRVADTIVHSTAASEQNLFAWFAEDGFFVLSVQKDFEFPRTLLRRLVELNLEL